MGLYDFKCKDCNTEFEISAKWQNLISMRIFCPTCGSENNKRIYYPVKFVIKNNNNSNKSENN